MKSNLLLTGFLMSISFFFKAQNLVFKEATVSRPAEFWKPFVLINGGNIENGVSFYITKSECGSENVKLLKLINQNAFPVVFSYQLSPSKPIVNVIIPASISIEGVCNSADVNTAKLVINPKENESENNIEEIKRFVLSSISVVEFK